LFYTIPLLVFCAPEKTFVIRNSINKLIRKVKPHWVTSGEKLRLLEKYYTKVVVERTNGSLIGLNDDYCIICKCDDTPSDVHIGRSRKQAIDRAYQELHKVIFFTQLNMD
jgi:hypothetical protein